MATTAPSPQIGQRAWFATGGGLLAIVFWSGSIGLSRELTEALGTCRAMAATYLLAGIVGGAVLMVTGRGGAIRRQPRRVLLGQGGLFVVYLVAFSLAVGLSRDASQLVEVGLINYLWPALTIAFSRPLLGQHLRPTFGVAVIVSLAGVLVAGLGPDAVDPERLIPRLGDFAGRLAADPGPYLLSLVNAVAWALYSNLARRQRGEGDGGLVPLFLLASGLVLAALTGFVDPATPRAWSGNVVGELVIMALLPALAAYWLWERAMREGRLTLIAALSYFIPLFSTIVTCWLQGLAFGPHLALASGLLVIGSWLCSRSVVTAAGPAG